MWTPEAHIGGEPSVCVSGVGGADNYSSVINGRADGPWKPRDVPSPDPQAKRLFGNSDPDS